MRENPDPDIIFMEPCTTTQTQQRGSCRLSTTSWQMFGARKTRRGRVEQTAWVNGARYGSNTGKSYSEISATLDGSCGCILSTDRNGRQFWVVAAERSDAGRFIVHAHQELPAFLELESAKPTGIMLSAIARNRTKHRAIIANNFSKAGGTVLAWA